MRESAIYRVVADFQDVFENRNNNFAVIKVLAAIAVSYGHSFALSPSSGAQDVFITELTGGNFYTGSLAVSIFFFISGALVTSSLLRLKSPLRFAIHRIFRIYPALLVSLAITSVAVIVTHLTKVDLRQLFSWFLINGAGGFNQWSVGGVFTSNTRFDALNGSLWSVSLELRIYLIVAVVSALLVTVKKSTALIFHVALIFYSQLRADLLPLIGSDAATFGNPDFHKYVLFYALGAVFYLSRIGEIRPTLSLLLAGSAFFAWFFLGLDLIVLQLSICLLILGLAKISIQGAGRLKSDISYGYYLYAWPVGQFVNMYVPVMSPVTHFLITLSLTAPLAVLSWVLIEKRFMGLGRVYLANWAKRIR